MIRNLTQIEHTIGDRVYHFACDPSSPINEVKEALYKFLGYVDAVEKKIAEAGQENKTDSEHSDVPPEEPKA